MTTRSLESAYLGINSLSIQCHRNMGNGPGFSLPKQSTMLDKHTKSTKKQREKSQKKVPDVSEKLFLVQQRNHLALNNCDFTGNVLKVSDLTTPAQTDIKNFKKKKN